MSYLGVDPGDLTPDEMYGRRPIDDSEIVPESCDADDDDDTEASEREQRIVAEHALAESRALLEAQPPRRGFFATLQSLREQAKCATCGKTTFVFNTATRGYRPEKITLETHCSCVGGPAHHLIGAGSGAETD